MTEEALPVGNTPLLELGGSVFAKAEFLNPSGSIKDRVVEFLLGKAAENGELEKGTIVTEATSGNTGISLAYLAPLFGVRAKIFMPRSASAERKKMIELLGAELELTETREEADALAKEWGRKKGFYYLNQFESPLNPLAHYLGTGREILGQFPGKISTFVASTGTGGTLAGIGRRIREKFPQAEIIGVIPKEKDRGIEGLRRDYSKKIVPAGTADRIARVSSRRAIESARFLVREKGVLSGISSGANYYAARKYGKGNTITILPDSWNRYYSTELFSFTEGLENN